MRPVLSFESPSPINLFCLFDSLVADSVDWRERRDDVLDDESQREVPVHLQPPGGVLLGLPGRHLVVGVHVPHQAVDEAVAVALVHQLGQREHVGVGGGGKGQV